LHHARQFSQVKFTANSRLDMADARDVSLGRFRSIPGVESRSSSMRLRAFEMNSHDEFHAGL